MRKSMNTGHALIFSIEFLAAVEKYRSFLKGKTMFQKSSFGWVACFDAVILDLLSLVGAFFMAYALRHSGTSPITAPGYITLLILILALDLLLLIFFDPLQDAVRRRVYKEFLVVLRHTLLLMMAIFTCLYAFKAGSKFSRAALFAMGGIYLFISFSVRVLWKKFRRSIHTKRDRSLLIITTKAAALNALDLNRREDFVGYRIHGLILKDEPLTDVCCGWPVVAVFEAASEYIRTHWVDEILIALPESEDFPYDLMADCINMGVTVHLNLHLAAQELVCKRIPNELAGLPVSTYSLNMMNAGDALLKRTIDILGGLAGCLLTGLMALFIVPAIKIASPGPAFFKQQRVGMNGKVFTIYKFRSMHMDAEARKAALMSQNKMEGLMFKMDFDPRVIGNEIVNGKEKTGIGDFIRRHSLDEFPQFLNVVKGDMSLVGTRPPTIDEFKQYETHHRVRMAVTPGITGLWQVSGRSEITDFEEIVRLDATYINSWDLGKDIKIILKTIAMVFKPKGAS